MSAFRTCCRWFDLISRGIRLVATVMSPFVIIGILVFVKQDKYEINLASGYTLLLFSIILTFSWNTVTNQHDEIVRSHTELITTPPTNSPEVNEHGSVTTLTTPPPTTPLVESVVSYKDGKASIQFKKTEKPTESPIDAAIVRIPIEQDTVSESFSSTAPNDAAYVHESTVEDSSELGRFPAADDVASVHEPTGEDFSSNKIANAVRKTVKTATDAAFAVSESVNAAADLAKSINQPVDESFNTVVGVLKNIKDVATETAATVVKPICDAGAATFTNASRNTPSMENPEDSYVPFTIPYLYRRKKISSDSGDPSSSEVSDPLSKIPALPRVKKSSSDSGVLSRSGSRTESSVNSFDKPDEDGGRNVNMVSSYF